MTCTRQQHGRHKGHAQQECAAAQLPLRNGGNSGD
jgi:hypothetical protein